MKKLLLSIVLGTVAMCLAVPALASANVYCVDTTPGQLGDNDSIDASCETPKGTIQEALGEASANPGEDSVLIGPGAYALPDTPNASELLYSDAGVLHMRGLGHPHLTMGGTEGSQTGLSVVAGDGSSVEGLTLTVPSNVDVKGDTGIYLAVAGSGQLVAKDLHVDGATAANARGFSPHRTVLTDSSVEFSLGASPDNTAIAAAGGDVTLREDTFVADFGISASGNTVTVERSRFRAWIGMQSDSGHLILRDSLVELVKRAGAIGVKLANDNNGISSIEGTLENDTIIGAEASQSTGVRVQANQTSETAHATIDSTVIGGVTKALQVWSDAEREATADVSYSSYDPNKVQLITDLDGTGTSGTSIYQPTAVANLTPGFVSPATGDYRLAPGSALVDAGDPAAPSAGEVDLDGKARAIGGICGTTVRRDIGAYELDPGCPPPSGGGEVPAGGGETQGDGGSGTPAGPEGTATGGTGGPAGLPQLASVPDTTLALRGKHLVKTRAKSAKVAVTVGGSVAGATYECRVDTKAWHPCAAASSFRLKPGKHQITAVASTAAGSDPTPATVRVRVVAASGH